MCIFVDRYLSFVLFSFGHCVVCPSNYGFWLSPLVSSSSSYCCLVQVIVVKNVLFIFFRHFVIHHDCEDDKPFHSIKLSCVREKGWDNDEWTIQVYWQRCALNTQDLDVNKKTNKNKTKHISESYKDKQHGHH
jgi:hypothetical protein